MTHEELASTDNAKLTPEQLKLKRIGLMFFEYGNSVADIARTVELDEETVRQVLDCWDGRLRC